MPKRPMKPPMAKKAQPAPSSTASTTPAASAASKMAPPSSKREVAPSRSSPPEGRASRSDSAKKPDTAVKKAIVPSPQALPATATVQLTSPLLSKQMVNECRVPASLLKQIGVPPGGCVRVVTTVGDAYLEALVGGAGKSIALHPVTLQELKDRDGDITRAPMVTHVVSGAVLAPDDESAQGAVSGAVTSQFLSTYRQRLIYVGMVCPVMLGTVTKHFVVKKLQGRKPSGQEMYVDYGKLVDTATVEVSGRVEEAPSKVLPENMASVKVTLLPSQIVEMRPGTTGHILFIGEPGYGKTHAVDQVCALLPQYTRVNATYRDLVGTGAAATDVASTISALRGVFIKARRSAPAVLVFDDLDQLMSGATGASGWAQEHLHSCFVEELRNLEDAPTVTVVATCSTLASLPSRFTSGANRFDVKIELEAPRDAADRLAVLQTLLAASPGTSDLPSSTVTNVAATAHGFIPSDLASIIKWAPILAYQRDPSTQKDGTSFTAADFEAAAKRVTPSAIKSFEVTIPKVRWSDIGGSDDAKKTIQECVEWCLGKDKELFQKFNLSPPKGVLLYGPPGCSKTMLAKALACESQLNFVSVKGPEVFSKWVGDSEKAVRDIFRRARLAAPCVVFIDELDGMCSHRGGGGVGDRVISQFLTELDGLPAAMSKKSDSIVFIAATNRPDNIDAAVLRPGRIDKKVYVGLPGLEERRQIASIAFRDIPLAPDVTPDYIANATEAYTGAEVVAVCKEAAFDAVRDSTSAEFVTLGNVEKAIAKVPPRIKAEEVQWYLQWGKDKK